MLTFYVQVATKLLIAPRMLRCSYPRPPSPHIIITCVRVLAVQHIGSGESSVHRGRRDVYSAASVD